MASTPGFSPIWSTRAKITAITTSGIARIAVMNPRAIGTSAG